MASCSQGSGFLVKYPYVFRLVNTGQVCYAQSFHRTSSGCRRQCHRSYPTQSMCGRYRPVNVACRQPSCNSIAQVGAYRWYSPRLPTGCVPSTANTRVWDGFKSIRTSNSQPSMGSCGSTHRSCARSAQRGASQRTVTVAVYTASDSVSFRVPRPTEASLNGNRHAIYAHTLSDSPMIASQRYNW